MYTHTHEVSTEILAITYVNDVQCCCSLRGTQYTSKERKQEENLHSIEMKTKEKSGM